MGILSACSLPLGTLTTLFWRPDDRSVGILMAFGGGALLAALTLDLVASALAQGHFPWLAAGCVLGGGMFVGLNNVINNHGGFLRKSSTVVNYLRRRSRKRFRKALGELERIGTFRDLKRHDLEEVASAAVYAEFEDGATVFSVGDPSDFLYVVAEGEVSTTDPALPSDPPAVHRAGGTPGYPLVSEAVEPSRVLADDLAADRLRDVRKLARDELLRVGPDAVGVREVAAPHDVVLAEDVE